MTETQQHTPGPWRTGEPDFYGTGIIAGEPGAEIVICRVLDNLLLNGSNAHLIAAAPDLLAALKSVMEWTEFHDVWFQRSLEEEIEAAIAKAEGKQ